MKKIPFHKPWITEAEERAVVNVLRSGWLTKGPQTEKFEKQFSRFVNVPHAVGLNSCTAGLHLALLSLGIGCGDEVITTPFTFAATANVIEHVGARVVFADIDLVTGNLSADAVQKKITQKTKAVIAVHLGGLPCAMDELGRVCKKKNIPIIEDAAHALGASYRGKKIGSWGRVASFSFYASKNATTGEGGMATTCDARIAKKLRILSLHGLSVDAWKRYMPSANTYYTVDHAGFKYNMFDIQAAMGIEQLKKQKIFMRQRKVLWDRYSKQLSDVPGIMLPAEATDGNHGRHLYIVTLKTGRKNKIRDSIMLQMRKKGIATQIHFIALHKHPFYRKKYGFKANDFPNANVRSQSCITLPLYPQLSCADVDHVSHVFRTLVGQEMGLS